MSPRDPFDDDHDEEPSTLDSFELIDEGLDLDGDLDDVPSRIPDTVEQSDDGIPLLDDVVESPDDLYSDYGQRITGDDRDLPPEVLPAVELERPAPPPVEASPEAIAAVRVEVRRRLAAEMDGILAGVADAAVRRVVQDLESTIRGELHETLAQRVGELIDEEIRNRFPAGDRDE
ncbi:MAG: hypothetical protein PVF91_03220 [Chromatiales bacterium]|jgi:hypothetical protein